MSLRYEPASVPQHVSVKWLFLKRPRLKQNEAGVDVNALYAQREREKVDNLLVRIHFIIVMIRWTGLAPWEFEFNTSSRTKRAWT